MVLKTVGLVVGAVAGAVAAVVAVRKTVECRKLYADNSKLYGCLHEMQVAAVEMQDQIDSQREQIVELDDIRCRFGRELQQQDERVMQARVEATREAEQKIEQLARDLSTSREAGTRYANDFVTKKAQLDAALATIEQMRAEYDEAQRVNKSLTSELLEMRDCWKLDKYKVLAEVEKLRQECAAEPPPVAQA